MPELAEGQKLLLLLLANKRTRDVYSRADSKCGRGQFWRERRRRRRQQCRALSPRRIWSDGGADDCEADRSWPFVTLLIAPVSGALFQQQHLTMTGCSCADHVPAATTVWCFSLSLFQHKQKERRGVFQRVRVFCSSTTTTITLDHHCWELLIAETASFGKKDERLLVCLLNPTLNAGATFCSSMLWLPGGLPTTTAETRFGSRRTGQWKLATATAAAAETGRVGVRLVDKKEKEQRREKVKLDSWQRSVQTTVSAFAQLSASYSYGQ